MAKNTVHNVLLSIMKRLTLMMLMLKRFMLLIFMLMRLMLMRLMLIRLMLMLMRVLSPQELVPRLGKDAASSKSNVYWSLLYLKQKQKYSASQNVDVDVDVDDVDVDEGALATGAGQRCSSKSNVYSAPVWLCSAWKTLLCLHYDALDAAEHILNT